MTNVPANLYPGLNDIADALEEIPIETSRYLTLLHEIDAKCVHSMPTLEKQIEEFLDPKASHDTSRNKLDVLSNINRLFEELMPSLEEEMHVSSIMLESLQKLTTRLEIAYEIAIKNQEVPSKLRLGIDNHPAMHLHHELMEKIDGKSNGNNGNGSKTSQALRSESRREAMVANKKQQISGSGVGDESMQADLSASNDLQQLPSSSIQDQDNTKKRTNATSNGVQNEAKKRKRRANVKTIPSHPATTTTDPVTTVPVSTTAVIIDPTDTTYLNSQADGVKPRTNDYGEPLYCYCNQVAYGEMVGCDGDKCELEWFHLPCINLDHLPKGKWYCDDCKKRL